MDNAAVGQHHQEVAQLRRENLILNAMDVQFENIDLVVFVGGNAKREEVAIPSVYINPLTGAHSEAGNVWQLE